MTDLHIHTDQSDDSRSSVQQVIASSFERGASVIAITDHFVDKQFALLSRDPVEVLGNSYSVRVEERFVVITHTDQDLLIVRGKEVSTKGGHHIIALAYHGQVHNFRDIDSTLAEIQQQGGIAIIPHPYNIVSHGIGGTRLKCLVQESATRELVDAIEAFNANGLFPLFWNNSQARRFSSRHSIPTVAVSDAHQTRHIALGSTLFEGTLDFTSDETFVTSFRSLLHKGPRQHRRTYVPVLQFFDWFLIPKIRRAFSRRPMTIQPPSDYRDY